MVGGPGSGVRGERRAAHGRIERIQFTTTVAGAEPASVSAGIRNRRPSCETSKRESGVMICNANSCCGGSLWKVPPGLTADTRKVARSEDESGHGQAALKGANRGILRPCTFRMHKAL